MLGIEHPASVRSFPRAPKGHTPRAECDDTNEESRIRSGNQSGNGENLANESSPRRQSHWFRQCLARVTRIASTETGNRAGSCRALKNQLPDSFANRGYTRLLFVAIIRRFGVSIARSVKERFSRYARDKERNGAWKFQLALAPADGPLTFSRFIYPRSEMRRLMA